MRKYGLVFMSALALTWMACGNNNTTDLHDHDHDHDHEHVQEQAVTGANIDPVCKMEKDDTWTEYSVNATDTIWFCSAHCKETFDKDPGKYLN